MTGIPGRGRGHDCLSPSPRPDRSRTGRQDPSVACGRSQKPTRAETRRRGEERDRTHFKLCVPASLREIQFFLFRGLTPPSLTMLAEKTRCCAFAVQRRVLRKRFPTFVAWWLCVRTKCLCFNDLRSCRSGIGEGKQDLNKWQCRSGERNRLSSRHGVCRTRRARGREGESGRRPGRIED
jgi:hypothetical protein